MTGFGMVLGAVWRTRWLAGPLALTASLAGAWGCDASSPECDTAGCAIAPLCPGTCESSCGCCPCSPGERECRNGQVYECVGSCRQLVQTCSSPDACIQLRDGTEAICAESSDACPLIKRAYEEAESSSFRLDRTVQPGMPPLPAGSYPLHDSVCRERTGCEVQMGHCEDGLGGPCWYLAESGNPLDHYAMLYRRLGCATPTTCDCPSPDIDVSCEVGQVSARCVVH